MTASDLWALRRAWAIAEALNDIAEKELGGNENAKV
jgi:hypothetical protein